MTDEQKPVSDPVAWIVVDTEGRMLYASVSIDSAQEWLEGQSARELRPLYLQRPPPEPVAYRRPYHAPRGPGYWLVPPGGPLFDGDEPLYTIPPDNPRRYTRS